MSITAFSFIMAILWFNIFIIFIAHFRKNNSIITCFSIEAFLLLVGFCFLRLFCFFEFPFTIVIPSEVVLPLAKDFLELHLFTFGSYKITVMNTLFLVWLIGSCFYLFRYIHIIYKFHAYIKLVPESSNPQIYACLESILAENTKRYIHIRLFQSEMVIVPMITGFFKPKIYLPKLNLTDKEMTDVLRHEWTHYLNKDIWIKLCMNLICIVFWWNPFTHILKTNLEQILEIRCDLELSKRMNQDERITYLESIYKILNHMMLHRENLCCSNQAVASALISTHNTSMLEQRFHLVAEKTIAKRRKQVLIPFCAILLTVFFISNIFIIQPVHPVPIDKENPVFPITDEIAYLVPNNDGSYALYVYDEYKGDILAEQINIEPLNTLQIKEKN